jgi:hypothetical protein
MRKPLVVAAMAAVMGFAETPPQSEAWFGALTGRNSQAVTETFRAGPVVTGKPYSAVIVTRTAQQFSNGTQIDHSETALVFRDAQGRTRVETDGGRSVTILDPVQNLSFEFRVPDQTAKHLKGKKTSAHVAYKRPLAASNQWTVQLPKVSSEPEQKPLGSQMVNGVSATGTRTTSIIAAGAIGNDKELRIEAERWYSPDLQVLVKSTYSDPRFGTTTYELTRISRSAPDPALFQVPAGYQISENSGSIGFGQTRLVYTPINK